LECFAAMVETIMYMGIGFLSAALMGIALMPLVHGRAVRLTERRLKAALPQDMNEIRADKDALRAEFAMAIRRVELTNEMLRNKNASQLVEIGKKSDNINQLKLELNTLKLVAAKVVAAYWRPAPIAAPRRPVGVMRLLGAFATRRSSALRPTLGERFRRAS
jgi:hypothetical protein